MGDLALPVERVGSGNADERRVRSADLQFVRLRGRLVAIWSFMASFRGDVPAIIEQAGEALDCLPEDDTNWRLLAMVALSDAHGYTGDMNAAYDARVAAMEACQAQGGAYYAILAGLKVIVTLREQGRLGRTLEACEQQLQAVNENGLSQTAMAGWLVAIRSEVQAELGDMEAALAQADVALELSERGENLAFLAWSYFSLIRVYVSAGELDKAQEIVNAAVFRGRQSNPPRWYTDQISNWQARLWIARGDCNRASKWALDRGLSADRCPNTWQETGYFLLLDCITLARMLVAEGHLDQSERLLSRLEDVAEAGGRTTRVIEILVLKALTLQAQNELEQALSILERALILAKPENFVQVFVDEGHPMARLLHEAAAQGTNPVYTSCLIVAFPDDRSDSARVPSTIPRDTGLIEPLSDREVEVLQLIAHGLSNQAIADRLFLSLNTVKAHNRNTFGKLAVSSRTQAVARARTLGIIDLA